MASLVQHLQLSNLYEYDEDCAKNCSNKEWVSNYIREACSLEDASVLWNLLFLYKYCAQSEKSLIEAWTLRIFCTITGEEEWD